MCVRKTQINNSSYHLFRLSTVGSRAFSVAAAKIWNALPESRSNDVIAVSPASFEHLKTFLFSAIFLLALHWT